MLQPHAGPQLPRPLPGYGLMFRNDTLLPLEEFNNIIQKLQVRSGLMGCSGS